MLSFFKNNPSKINRKSKISAAYKIKQQLSFKDRMREEVRSRVIFEITKLDPQYHKNQWSRLISKLYLLKTPIKIKQQENNSNLLSISNVRRQLFK